MYFIRLGNAIWSRINPQRLYFYERIGLIPPPQRTEAGYRLFSELDVDRLAFITRAKSLGLSLDDIKEILSLPAMLATYSTP